MPTDRSVMAINNQVLAAQVDGSLNYITVNPPSGGWPTGGSFRINLVKDPNSLDTILAQSSEFVIKAPAVASSSHTSSGSTTRTVTSNTPITQPATTSASATTASVPSSTKSDSPRATNADLKSFRLDFGLVPLVAALGFFLA
ncbi:hypothetical protein DXG03_000244 [Asterophora parasitica]|uniref:Uncharacterized protein n=1 Tax=Asterophora parasitica TaxID=117018 RepID=A0A9P7GKC9_9AGAR|nr:hypothetical protein DXG03_000244 [Asterophora parasitica]